MGLLDNVNPIEETEEDLEAAHEILDRLGYHTSIITPTRVVFASFSALLIASATLFAMMWIIPYNNVDMDVVYKQSGFGHVVLAELDNKGSREIEDVVVSMRFLDSEDVELARTDFFMSSLPAHSSISNTPSDDLELVILGESVWENYTIEVTLEYRYYGGDSTQLWTAEVGHWTQEFFTIESSFRLM
ncbi:MAG TPA: hypothetical protein QF703_01065 [Candidatus Thalassarchaeaceae archaeon]|nr:hypothetical protein [Candidatus Thalassarchaeaceae archaeon]